ncbi:MAG TPA: Gmad2 immunoglobulin-like domain-containing protein, partial [Herpetosiphonaceae bacterium]|nr:Gmad2 immunoglobulin-like domain-containing protein [Herpetosiphonaceae bacterium]
SAGNLTPRPTVGATDATQAPGLPSPIPATQEAFPPTEAPAPSQIPAEAPTSSAPSPSPTEAPTVAVPPTEAPVELEIALAAPAAGTVIESPVRISGRATLSPFEQNFGVAIYDSEGNQIGGGGITGVGEYGQPSDFDGEIEFTAPATARPGKIVVFVDSPKDGAIISQAEVQVRLAGYAGGGEHISLPAENASVTLPLHVEVANATPHSSYGLRLTYADGTVLQDDLPTPLHGPVPTSAAANMMWSTETTPPKPPSQSATLELVSRTGEVLATRNVYVWDTYDPTANVMPLKIYFLFGEEVHEQIRYVPRTASVATAALRELSWGPTGNEVDMAGFTSALPTTNLIADRDPFPADWTSRVRLQSISIRDGVAFVDWSKEMAAWGGGSARLGLLTRQVEQTLAQFPTITGVQMTVDGSAEVLQP